MTDKLRKLIKDLPSVEPENESVNKLVAKIIRREIRRLWEKRISIITGLASLLLGVFVVREIIRVAEMLDSSGFWRLLLSDWSWWAKDYQALWWAFLDANPLKEIGHLVLLLAIFSFSLYILFRKDD
jgi:hypothetical protein